MGGVNPAMVAALLKARLGGAAGAGATGAPGAGGEEDLNPAARSLQASNPDFLLKMVSQIRKQIIGVLPILSEMNPASARALMSTVKGFDAAVKELQQVQATAQAVGGPIQSSAIPQPQPPGSGAPSLPNPANVTM